MPKRKPAVAARGSIKPANCTGRMLLERMQALLEKEGLMDAQVLFACSYISEGLLPACAYLDDKGQGWIDLDVPLVDEET